MWGAAEWGSDVIFWPSFAAAGVVPVGIVATAIHLVFAVLELWAYVARASRATAASG